jgi:hypothetical protein
LVRPWAALGARAGLKAAKVRQMGVDRIKAPADRSLP